MDPNFQHQGPGANRANNNRDHPPPGLVLRRALATNNQGDNTNMTHRLNAAFENLRTLLHSLAQVTERGSGDAFLPGRQDARFQNPILSDSSENLAPVAEVEARAEPEHQGVSLVIPVLAQTLVSLLNASRPRDDAVSLNTPSFIRESIENPEPAEETVEPTGAAVSSNQESSEDQDKNLCESSDDEEEGRFDEPPNQSPSTAVPGLFSQSLYNRCPVHLFNIPQEPSTIGPSTATSNMTANTTKATTTATDLESHSKRTKKRNPFSFYSFFRKIFSKKSSPKPSPAEDPSRSSSRPGSWFSRVLRKTAS